MHETTQGMQGGGLLNEVVTRDSILCTEELNRRPSRPPDHEKENRALAALVLALADSPHTILQKLADTILEVFQCGSAGISLLTVHDGGKRFYWPAIAGVWKPHIGDGTPRDFGPCGDVLDRNSPLLFTHFERLYTYFLPVTPPVEECLLVPFYVGGMAVGTIWAIAHDNRRKFDAEDTRQLVSLGRFASAAYQAVASSDDLQKANNQLEERVLDRTRELRDQIRETRRAEEHLRNLTGRLLQSQDDERRRIARELHDSVGQLLVAISMNISKVDAEKKSLSSSAKKCVEENLTLVQQVSQEIRTISHLLHPPLLDEIGLESAIKFYIDGFVERSKIDVDLDMSAHFDRLSSDQEIAIFRTVQECLTNIHRHSGSQMAAVRVVREDSQVRLEIRDEGKGIPPEKQDALNSSGTLGVGFRGMRERLRQLGGTLEIHSNENGTLVSASLPVPSAATAGG
jgi:signal transduction histidine kinase